VAAGGRWPNGTRLLTESYDLTESARVLVHLVGFQGRGVRFRTESAKRRFERERLATGGILTQIFAGKPEKAKRRETTLSAFCVNPNVDVSSRFSKELPKTGRFS
jgi:hypothetical protein